MRLSFSRFFLHSAFALLSLLVAACASSSNTPPTPLDGSADSGLRPDSGPPPTVDGGPDAGMLPTVGLCEECVLSEQCGPTARCIETSGGDRICVAICNPDIPSCPRGFDCVLNFSAPDVTTCVPIGELCCIDQDADGYGLGASCLGPDCDDMALERNPGAAELCNGGDDDCDDSVDEMASDCGAQRCVDVGSGTYQEVPPDECVTGECTMQGATACGLYTCADGEDMGDFCATACNPAGADDDAYCVRTAHCDTGACGADLPNGDACDEDTDCESSHCDNGFCCNDGACCSVASDCPSVGGIGTTCDDTATCQGSRGEIVCEMNQCGTRSGVPDDSACDSTIEANTCGFADSVYCTGATNQPPPTCPGTCASDSACDMGAHCDTVCVPNVPDGDPCDESSDCTSGYCNDNICCSGGDCCRTPSDCPGSYSTAPTCDSTSTCQGTRDAATCASFVCGTSADVPDDSACTTSVEALMCGLYPSRFCTGGTDQTPPVCATACTADSECDSGSHCDLNACVPNVPNGMACDESSDCTSGHCQNGFCCATGDCCAGASDCSAAAYGEPAVCNSAATCQGTRRDPACNSASQCQLGGVVDDDSACAGLLANTCGLYPSVFCTAAMTQPTDQMSLCAMMCTTSADCDAGAFCMSGMCQPRGMAGDACTATAQCESGLSCVDGVCCTSSCTGTCRACNVPGSLGTCTDVPAGTDPAGECGGLSCSTYYYGWVGDMCYRRADAPASAVDCDGAGACEGAADVCPSAAQGTLQLDCDDLCQSPNGGTCTGTSAGACNNVTPSPSTQSCGTGACQVTANRCNAGTQVMCVPGSPSAETCNDLDDNCNGVTDDGLSGDGYEANNSCAQANFRGTLYSQAASGQPSSLSITPTIYGSGDIDVFRVNWEENDSTCGCSGLFATDEDYGLTATITVPTGAGSYRICSAMGGTCSTGSTCTTVAAGSSGSVTIWQDGCCSPIGCGDSGTGWFTIEGIGAPGFECRPYTLGVSTVRGCR